MSKRARWYALLLLLAFARAAKSYTAPFETSEIHQKGHCAMYGLCGTREDGRFLNCPESRPAVTPDVAFSHKLQGLCPEITGDVCCSEDQFDVLRNQVKQAVTFIAGCPACLRNFLNFFCALACSPDQSSFVNVTAIAPAFSSNRSSVAAIDVFVNEDTGQRMYEACAEVKFAAMNTRAMDFIGGGAHNYKEWFAFMGHKADLYEPGSPYAIAFPSKEAAGSGLEAWQQEPVACSDAALACSCGDCPSAPGCAPPRPPPETNSTGCKVHIGSYEMHCLDFGLLVAFAVYLASVLAVWRIPALQLREGHHSGVLEKPLLAEENENGVPDAGAVQSAVGAKEVGEGEGSGSSALKAWFRGQGVWAAQHPFWTLLLCALITGAMAAGMLRFRVETRPEKLWVRPDSQAAKEKAIYDEHLGPFYRIEQLILATEAVGQGEAPSIVTDANLQLMFNIQSKVDALRANVSGKTISLKDICFKPLGEDCAIQSVLQYWQLDGDKLDEYGGFDHADFCFQHYSTSAPCLSAFQAPMDPNVVLGGFQGTNYSRATAFVVTYPVNNALDQSGHSNAAAVAWEAAFLHLVQSELVGMAQEAGLTLAYSAESSVEDELKRESSMDVATIVVSYLMMFVYISLTLGDLIPGRSVFVTSKVTLGFSGVLLVLLSVLAAIGFCSAMGVKSTLIIVEVIPFLVLAVGVDNMCILVHALKRQPLNMPLEARVGAALAEVGPSITLASLSEAVAFAVGTLTPMPACRVFSLFAAVAVAVDYLLQVTAFVALLALDFRRAEAHQVDCLPCVTADEDQEEGTATQLPKKSLLMQYMERVHAPALSLPPVKAFVMALFGGMFLAAVALCARLSPGLEQQVALPRDSYLQGYFSNITEYLHVGPPVFFVVQDFNYSLSSGDTDKLCSISGCRQDSLLNEVTRAAQSPESSFIARPAASWLDDFLTWLSPKAFGCCRQFPNHHYCPPDDQPPCCPDGQDCDSYDICSNCTSCFLPGDLVDGRPNARQFREKLPWFLRAVPSADCAKGGHGAYSHSLDLAGFEKGVIRYSEFRSYHTPLQKQADFVDSLRAAREFTTRLSEKLKISVFPYSVFYIFFEQYLDIFNTAVWSLSLASGAVFLVCLLLTGSFWTAVIILGVLLMIVVDLMGIMALWNIQLNAVSVVNLVMAIGIAVEFCVHITHAFAGAQGARQERASHALATMGSSVLSGITLTKFAGVAVLFFARSAIFETYYFRMYFGLVLLGALHGLILLPVVLSICGPLSSQSPR